ncbi:hypothetical protein IscW_ISCW021355 [Ixodes scapularis]|uniref:Uncharacterized protein n=1 Tax=Ixodes scapularis TaxID=6945 RepID=B7Q578_IXOSC|nr:hypothetical protein IscW_ISCW021355 [Ixodes scapularis]|eukprot:XP_002411707.1 hypothetical protein IscW_ISCW021355 [Ixodes scapularis]
MLLRGKTNFSPVVYILHRTLNKEQRCSTPMLVGDRVKCLREPPPTSSHFSRADAGEGATFSPACAPLKWKGLGGASPPTLSPSVTTGRRRSTNWLPFFVLCTCELAGAKFQAKSCAVFTLHHGCVRMADRNGFHRV